MVMVDPKTGKMPDRVLEETGIAYDPRNQHLDLSKEEKRRTTALMLAIQAYEHLIIPTAEYLREVINHERNGGPVIEPATMNAMVQAAVDFDDFISGDLQARLRVAVDASRTGRVPKSKPKPEELASAAESDVVIQQNESEKI